MALTISISISKMNQSQNQTILQEKIRIAKDCFKLNTVNIDAVNRLCFFDKLGLVYNRVQKNANTTLVTILCSLNGLRYTHNIQAKNWCWQSYKHYPSMGSISKKILIIRNPYSRVLSAFLEKFTYQRDKFVPLYGDFQPTPDGFKKFIEYLHHSGIQTNSHWNLQQTQIVAPLKYYDYIIRFENLADELEKMLFELNLMNNKINLLSLHPSDIGKKTNSDSKLKEFYTEDITKKVLNLYKQDFDFLSYSYKFIT